jgi:hypothetical protein
LTPQDLKLGVTDALNALLEPIRQEFANSPEFQQAFDLAYPKPGKKVKKVKDKGSKYPGTNPITKTAKKGAEVVASEGIAEDIVANGLGVGSNGGQSKTQTQAAGKGVEDALSKLDVSDTRQ